MKNKTLNSEPDRCLNPECDGLAYVRGLCRNCYGTARRLVVAGSVTWGELEKRGKCDAGKMTHKNDRALWFLATK